MQCENAAELRSASVAVADDAVAPMLLGVAVATVTLVAACVVSVVFGPDAEVLNPIDGRSSSRGSDGNPGVDCSLGSDATARTEEPTSSEEGAAA